MWTEMNCKWFHMLAMFYGILKFPIFLGTWRTSFLEVVSYHICHRFKAITSLIRNLNILGPTLSWAHIFQTCPCFMNQTQVELYIFLLELYFLWICEVINNPSGRRSINCPCKGWNWIWGGEASWNILQWNIFQYGNLLLKCPCSKKRSWWTGTFCFLQCTSSLHFRRWSVLATTVFLTLKIRN